MIPLNSFQLFASHIDSLKNISVDNHAGQGQKRYATASEVAAVSFDLAKLDYVESLGCPFHGVESVDALAWNKTTGRYLMIEFKSGEVHSKEIKRKVRSSLLIFLDVIGKTISYTRKEMDFILVSNGPARRDDFRLLGDSLNALANIPFSSGFENYGLYFKEARQMSPAVFEDYLGANELSTN